MNNATHQGIRDAIRTRIVSGEWKLGDLIPGEVDFAAHYGCSRTTVNRALQALAEEGIVERKRKGGTRVRPMPAPQAQFRIPIVREQVESLGHAYATKVLKREIELPPLSLRSDMQLPAGTQCAYLESIHLADDQPFAFERRWVNLATVPSFVDANLHELSANEWLVKTVPFSRGDVSLSGTSADNQLAEMLQIQNGAALFTMDRTTWFEDRSVTRMTLFYRQGYRLSFEI